MTYRITKTYDDALVLHEWGTALTASDFGTDASDSALIRDLGAGLVEGDVIIDVSQLDVDTGNEMVTIGVQISSSATFASDNYQVACIQIGDAAALAGDTDMTTGRYVLPFNNMIADGTTKRYMRIYFTIAGTVAGFKCLAYATVRGRQ